MESGAAQGCSESCRTSQQHGAALRSMERHPKTWKLKMSDTTDCHPSSVCRDMWHLLPSSPSCQPLWRAVKAAASGSPESPEQVLRKMDHGCSACSGVAAPASVARERGPCCTWEERIYITVSCDLLLSSLSYGVGQLLSVAFRPGCWHALLQLTPEGEHISNTATAWSVLWGVPSY